MTSFKAFEPSDAMIRALEARVAPKGLAFTDPEPEASHALPASVAAPTTISYTAGAGKDAPYFKAAAGMPARMAEVTSPGLPSAASVRGEPEYVRGLERPSPKRSPPAPSERRRPRANAGPLVRKIDAHESRQRPAGRSDTGAPTRAAPRRAVDRDTKEEALTIFLDSPLPNSGRPTPSAASARPPLFADRNGALESGAENSASADAGSSSMPSRAALDAAPNLPYALPAPSSPDRESVAGARFGGAEFGSEIGELSDDRWQQLEAEAKKIPSVVTCGGVPVAQDGDLVYLGAGLYAAAAPTPEPQPREALKRRRCMKPLQGRVRAPVPLMPRSLAAHRSLSARAARFEVQQGSRRGSRSGDDAGSPLHAFSDGQLDREFTLQPDAELGGAAAGPRAWRPAGASKLPPPPPVEPRSLRHPAVASTDLGRAAAHSEARARDREAQRREEPGLFGPHGFLQELAKGQQECQRREVVVGAPTNSESRAAERAAAKDARTRIILEERAERLAVEAATNSSRGIHRGLIGSSSAPVLGMPRLRLDTQPQMSTEEINQQKMRVACKMEILDFFNGYHNAIGKMTAEQTKHLLAKLHNGLDSDGLSETVQECEQERDMHQQEWYEKSEQRRLQEVNDRCNKAFERTVLDESDLDL